MNDFEFEFVFLIQNQTRDTINEQKTSLHVFRLNGNTSYITQFFMPNIAKVSGII